MGRAGSGNRSGRRLIPARSGARPTAAGDRVAFHPGERICRPGRSLRSAAAGPAEVAERLLALATATELDTLRDRLGEYRAVLGPQAWQALPAAAETAGAEVPAGQPGDDEPDRYGPGLLLITVMERLVG